MIDCRIAKDLIERILEGTISDADLDELETHIETCQTCREEFKHQSLLGEMVREAFLSRTGAGQAKARVLERLAEASPRREVSRFGVAGLLGVRTAVAAGILLAAGLSAGFFLGRASSVRPDRPPRTAEVPMRVADLEGTVLVKHRDADVWRTLKAGAGVCLGDTFHSAAGSSFALRLENGKSTITVSQNSMLALTSYGGETQFFLQHGEFTADLESPHGPFFVSTPHGRVEAMGTEFTVSVE